MAASKVFGRTAVHEGTAADTPTTFNCANRSGSSVMAAAETALADFKNPYSTSVSAVRDSDTSASAKADMGYVNLEVGTGDAADTITVTTCFQNDCKNSATDNVENEIEVAE